MLVDSIARQKLLQFVDTHQWVRYLHPLSHQTLWLELGCLVLLSRIRTVLSLQSLSEGEPCPRHSGCALANALAALKQQGAKESKSSASKHWQPWQEH